MLAALVIAQLALAGAAALAVGAGRSRRTAAAALVVAASFVPQLAANALAGVALAVLALVTALRVTQLLALRSAWPAARRVRHVLALAPLHGDRPLERPWRSLERHAATCALAIGALVLGRNGVRARTVAEFWGKRWNRAVGEWLGEFVFAPLARCGHPALGLMSAFVASALVHAWLAAVALGELRAALSIAAYFVVQGGAVLVERRLGVRAWPPAVARAWTALVVAGPSPLGVGPFLRTLGF